MKTSVIIHWRGLDLVVFGDFEPSEAAILHGHPDNWEEGSSAYFEVEKILWKGEPCEALMESDLLEEIADEAATVADQHDAYEMDDRGEERAA